MPVLGLASNNGLTINYEQQTTTLGTMNTNSSTNSLQANKFGQTNMKFNSSMNNTTLNIDFV